MLVQVIATENETDDALGSIVADFSSAQLRRLGIPVENLRISSYNPEDLSSDSSIAQIGVEAGATHVLTGRIGVTGERYRLDLDLYDVASGSVLASSSAGGRIGLTLDLEINNAVQAVVDSIRGELPIGRPAMVPISTREVEKLPVPAADGTPRPTPVPEASGHGTKRAIVDTRGQRPKAKVLEIGTAAAPFITVGRAGDYFRTGFLAHVYGTYRFNRPTGYFGLGFRAGINGFRAAGAVLETENLLVPVGIDLRYSSEAEPFGVFFHANGGAAAMIVETVPLGRLFKVAPFASGGAGMKIAFSHFMGIAIDMTFTAYFESSLVIMGLSPSAVMYFSL